MGRVEFVPAGEAAVAAEEEKISPAVLMVVEQLFATEQLAPLGQHCRELEAAFCSLESVTVADAPFAAAG